jgi:hypothetical protein
MHPDDNVAAAARLALEVEESMPNNKARAALESLPGTKVVRRVLAALCNDTNKEEEQDNNNEEEQGNNGGEDRFVVTQDNDTKDDETLHRSTQLWQTRQTTTAALASMT